MAFDPRPRDRKGKSGLVFLYLAFLCVVVAFNVNFVACVNTRQVEALCNTESYGNRIWYEKNLGKLVDELIELTPELSFKVCGRYPLWAEADVCFGCAACNGHLSPADCGLCLRTISDNYVKKACKGRYGMNVKVEDCRMRYESYAFDIDSF